MDYKCPTQGAVRHQPGRQMVSNSREPLECSSPPDGSVLTLRSFHSVQSSRSGSKLCSYSRWPQWPFPRCGPRRRSAPCLKHSTIRALAGAPRTHRGSRKTGDCAQLTGLAAAVLVCCLSALRDATGHMVDISLGRVYCCAVKRKLTGSQSRGLYGGQEVFVSLVMRCPLTFSQVYCTHLSSGGTYVSFTCGNRKGWSPVQHNEHTHACTSKPTHLLTHSHKRRPTSVLLFAKDVYFLTREGKME